MNESHLELLTDFAQLLKSFEERVGIVGCDIIFPDVKQAVTWDGSKFVTYHGPVSLQPHSTPTK